MRVTTSMLSETTVQAGIQMGGNSLVNYLNGDMTDSLASSLGNKHKITEGPLAQKKYEKLKDAAEKLGENAAKLSGEGSRSIYEKARKSEDASEVYDEVEKMISNYNDLLEKVRTDTSTLGRFYQQSLKEVMKENKDALAAMGITIDKSGKLSVEKEKLRTSDLDRVESVFGANGTISGRISVIAEKVADSAKANLKSASSQYNSSGNSVDALLRNYDAKS